MEFEHAIGPPEWFVNVSTGVVLLRLVPYCHPPRHGRFSTEPPPRGDAAVMAGLPFPLRPDDPPFDRHLHRGQSRETLKLEPEGQWWAYALTPFGWVLHIDPELRRGRLRAVKLQPYTAGDALETFARVAAWLSGEVGPPKRLPGRPPAIYRSDSPDEWRSLPKGMRWRLSWGTLLLGWDPRDHEPFLTITWGSGFSLRALFVKQ